MLPRWTAAGHRAVTTATESTSISLAQNDSTGTLARSRATRAAAIPSNSDSTRSPLLDRRL